MLFGSSKRGTASSSNRGGPDPRQGHLAGGARKNGLKPTRKRALVRAIPGHFPIGVRRACGLLKLHWASWYDRPHGRDDTALRTRPRELAQARPRFGSLRLHVLLRREGWVVNPTRVHRVYPEEGLTVRLTRRRKRASHLRVVPPQPRQRMSGGVGTLGRTRCSTGAGSEPSRSWITRVGTVK